MWQAGSQSRGVYGYIHGVVHHVDDVDMHGGGGRGKASRGRGGGRAGQRDNNRDSTTSMVDVHGYGVWCVKLLTTDENEN